MWLCGYCETNSLVMPSVWFKAALMNNFYINNGLKAQCVSFIGIYWQDMAETECNVHKYHSFNHLKTRIVVFLLN